MAAKAFVPVEAFPWAHRSRGHGRRLQGHDVASCGTIHHVTIGVATMRVRVIGADPVVQAWVVPVKGAGDMELTRTPPTFVKQRLQPYKSRRVNDYMTERLKTGTGKIDGQALKRGG